jgi:hypothetical protein
MSKPASSLSLYAPHGARIGLGLIYFVFGLNGFLHFLPTPPPSGAAGTFLGGLAAAGYFFPLLKATEVLGGLALLTNRAVPLALVVLAPITVQILAYHTLLAGGAGLSIAMAALHLGIAWAYRDAFYGLFAFSRQPLRAGERQTDPGLAKRAVSV